MHNTIIYILWIIVDLSLLLVAFALWGKAGIIAIIASNVVIMNIFVLKGIVLFGLDATGGNVLYASIFLGTDILTEYYGAREARKVVFIGFFIAVFLFLRRGLYFCFPPPIGICITNRCSSFFHLHGESSEPPWLPI